MITYVMGKLIIVFLAIISVEIILILLLKILIYLKDLKTEQ